VKEMFHFLLFANESTCVPLRYGSAYVEFPSLADAEGAVARATEAPPKVGLLLDTTFHSRFFAFVKAPSIYKSQYGPFYRSDIWE
jgi:hypothetical protein